MNCLKCGAEINNNDQYCKKCGHKQLHASLGRMRMEEVEREKLEGIGGWLVLFQIGVYLQIAQYVQFFFHEASVDWLGWVVLAFIVVYIVILSLFYKRDIRFRTLYTVMMGISSIAIIASMIMMPITMFTGIIGLIGNGLLVWALYKSKRVKYTFSHPKKSEECAQADLDVG